MTIKEYCIAVAAILFFSIIPGARSYEAQINGEHSSITFELGSTWHTIYGTANEYSGKIVFDDPLRPTRVTGKIDIKADSLTTGLNMRDEKLRNFSLEVKKYPLITYTITEFRAGELLGELVIKDVTKVVALKLTSEKKGGYMEHTGVAHINWADYNVIDPSIFIATVDKKITIKVIVRLPLN